MNPGTRVQKWQALLAEQSASGLSKKAFCEREGINAATFYYWQRRLAEPASEKTVGFQRIQPTEEHEVIICLTNQELRLRSSSSATLAQIIQHLGHA